MGESGERVKRRGVFIDGDVVGIRSARLKIRQGDNVCGLGTVGIGIGFGTEWSI